MNRTLLCACVLVCMVMPAMVATGQTDGSGNSAPSDKAAASQTPATQDSSGADATSPSEGGSAAQASPDAAADQAAPADAAPADEAGRRGDEGFPGARGRGRSRRPTDSAPTSTSQADEVSVSLRGMSVDQVATFLSEKLKRPVLTSPSIKDKKVEIVSKQKMPLDEALWLINQALLEQEVLVEVTPRVVYIRSVSEALKAGVPRYGPDVPMSSVDPAVMVAAKEFVVTFYDMQKLAQVLQPMLPSYGQITCDTDNRKLVVTDSVANLCRIEKIIQGMDVPMSERTVTEIIELKNADPIEVIGILRWLIAGRMGIEVSDIATVTGQPAAPGQPPQPALGMPEGSPSRRGDRGDRGGGGAASPPAEVTVTKVERGRAPVTLVPNVLHSWIIAVAPPEIMPQIKQWAVLFDTPREVEKDYEVIEIQYADVDAIATQIAQVISSMPNVELRQSTRVSPVSASRRLIVFGSRAGRGIVADLVKQLDIQEAGKRTRRTFDLKHADAEYMATRIRSLFESNQKVWESRWSTEWRVDPQGKRIQVVADRRRNAVSVMTDPETMKEVAQLIEEEDKPINADDVLPKVYDLKYVSPAEMRDLLEGLFSTKRTRGGSFLEAMFFGMSSSSEEESTAVSRLLGQFTFQVLPSSSKLLVSTKSSGNYVVIDRLVERLDQPHTADLPVTVELKYANAEDLCEQLNAMLAEPGQYARIRRADRGLTEYSTSDRTVGSTDAGTNSQTNQNQSAQQSSAAEMVFWWQGFRPPANSTPASNVIGRTRIVPVYRRNALLVLSPPMYRESIVKLIGELDNPGRQVVIRARVGEIQHEGQTTLGLRFASDPSLLPPAEQAVAAGADATYRDVLNGVWTLSANINVDALVSLLMRKFDMKILLAPTLTTSDNEASEYFDGQDVPIQTQTRQSAEGTSTVTDIAYEPIGTRLRVRPHVTQNNNVDLMVNLEISRIVPGSSALGNFIFDRREVTTHVIVNDGQTVMLSGIIQQDRFEDVRKLPLLGDIPLLGLLFRHTDKGVHNREMVVFLTPFVIETPQQLDEQMAQPRDVMKRVEHALGTVLDDKAATAPQEPPESSPPQDGPSQTPAAPQRQEVPFLEPMPAEPAGKPAPQSQPQLNSWESAAAAPGVSGPGMEED